MKVKELIDELSTVDQDCEVYIRISEPRGCVTKPLEDVSYHVGYNYVSLDWQYSFGDEQ